MNIGDEVFVHGYVDEIRRDVVIIRNDGGYFGTVENELVSPSAQPERKKGKWVKNERESAKHVEAIYVCSSCHNFEAWGETEKYNFCPNCGADMRGGDENEAD